MVSRKRQQAELMFSLGQFFGPILRIADNPNDFDADEKTRIFARFFHDHNAFNQLLVEFCNTGEPGHQYAIQFAQAQHQIGLIHALVVCQLIVDGSQGGKVEKDSLAFN
ncbi:hypothetical protein [Stenomitos frigidus]|uniref:Uncharacterized protein n=1 Tax=Stenomitos frigidus ULC18 TaxID=2107698 RepID=A0A2T1DUX3_9CYAN|nr:hypothetical protein [Stenomitos frigidus]PSB24298.1 hypothetical protein C7B82_27860 [Stenomitos frigidus ULC18]